MKTQVVVIHGGDSFIVYRDYLRYLKNRPISIKRFLPKVDWKSSLSKELGRNFQVLMPQMPNKNNARYTEWKIWFERMLPYLHHNVILVGHSLGGIFLAKYLTQRVFPKKVKAVMLVAAPHNNRNDIGDFRLPISLNRLSKQAPRIFLFQSQDDPVVPVSEFKQYVKALPTAKKVPLKNRGHFSQEHFPEIVRLIKRVSIAK